MQDIDKNYSSDEEDWRFPAELPALPNVSSIDVGTSAYKSSKQPGDICGTVHTRTIIHIDMDCFYAQVEMIRNPHLRDKPIGIQQKSLLATTNYKARELGVKKMMGLKEAQAICPQLILVNGEDLTHYREMSYRISELCLKYTPKVERLGFDENFLDVTHLVSEQLAKMETTDKVVGHTYRTQEEGHDCHCGCEIRLRIGSHIAAEIRQALYRQLGVTCCAGVAHNKLLSKLVAGQHKPNQQTTLFPDQAIKLLASLSKPTMSDEDSFRNCNSLSVVHHKIEDLLESLLKRLLGDGRLPRTLRLAVRRRHESRYGGTESRQCPLARHLFNKFTPDCMDRVHKRLTEMAMNLFHRLVDVKEPFNISVISVAFTKLEQQTKNDINTFFQIEPCISVRTDCGTQRQSEYELNEIIQESDDNNNDKSLCLDSPETKSIQKTSKGDQGFFLSKLGNRSGRLSSKTCSSKTTCSVSFKRKDTGFVDKFVSTKADDFSFSVEAQMCPTEMQKSSTQPQTYTTQSKTSSAPQMFSTQPQTISKQPQNISVQPYLVSAQLNLSAVHPYISAVQTQLTSKQPKMCPSKTEPTSGVKRRHKNSLNAESFFEKKRLRLVKNKEVDKSSEVKSQIASQIESIRRPEVPPGIDPNLLLQLPQDMQQEVLQDLLPDTSHSKQYPTRKRTSPLPSVCNAEAVSSVLTTDKSTHKGISVSNTRSLTAKLSEPACYRGIKENINVDFATSEALGVTIQAEKVIMFTEFSSGHIEDDIKYLEAKPKGIYAPSKTAESIPKCGHLFDECSDRTIFTDEITKVREAKVKSITATATHSEVIAIHTVTMSTVKELESATENQSSEITVNHATHSKMYNQKKLSSPHKIRNSQTDCNGIKICSNGLKCSGLMESRDGCRDPEICQRESISIIDKMDDNSDIENHINGQYGRGSLNTNKWFSRTDSSIRYDFVTPVTDKQEQDTFCLENDSEVDLDSNTTQPCRSNIAVSEEAESRVENKKYNQIIPNSEIAVPNNDFNHLTHNSEMGSPDDASNYLSHSSKVSSDCNCFAHNSETRSTNTDYSHPIQSSEIYILNDSSLVKSKISSTLKKQSCVMIPPDVDPEVFSSLPPSLQKELLLEWELRHMQTFTKTNLTAKHKPKGKICEQLIKSKKKENETILKFFRHANKSTKR